MVTQERLGSGPASPCRGHSVGEKPFLRAPPPVQFQPIQK